VSDRLEIDPQERQDYAPAPPPRRNLRRVVVPLMIVVAGAGAWWGYRIATRPVIPATVPEIHAAAGPVKEAPANPGGMVVPDQDSLLLNREGKSNAKAEQLLPPPEKALPRPVAPMATQAPTTTTLSTTAPSSMQAAPQAVAPAAEAPPPAAPKTASVAPPPAKAQAPAPTTPAASGGWRVQLGALRSEAQAQQAWARLKKAQPDLLGKLALSTPKVDLGSKGIFYRIQAGPLADEAHAAATCNSLKSRHVACLVVKP
jgi:cell division septation protein DedD